MMTNEQHLEKALEWEKSFTTSVFEFNKKRNNFDLDLELEAKMLKEELKEFFDGEDLADRLDAYVDYMYVALGTGMKVCKHQAKSDKVNSWLQDISANIEYLDKLVFNEGVSADNIEKAKKIVCYCNAFKGTELDENGKVKKVHGTIPDATELIRMMLEGKNNEL